MLLLLLLLLLFLPAFVIVALFMKYFNLYNKCNQRHASVDDFSQRVEKNRMKFEKKKN